MYFVKDKLLHKISKLRMCRSMLLRKFLYISFNPVDKTSEADAVIAIENCIRDVRAWMREELSFTVI